MNTDLRHFDVLRKGAWFRSLAPDLQQRLLVGGVVRGYAVGETLFRRGDAADGLYAVIHGAIRIKSTNMAGKEAILAHIDSPGWFGEIGLFDRLPRTHDAVSDTESTLLHVPTRTLDRMLQAQPD